MSTMTNVLKHGYNEDLNRYIVVHPLDDVPEEKIETAALGRMPMTPAVKWSLISLRGYLILMSVMVLWTVVRMAAR